MSEFSLNAAALAQWAAAPAPASREDAFLFWADLADAIGPALLPILARRDALGSIPYPELGMRPFDPRRLLPQPGEMWVLFCFSDSFRAAAQESPLRNDGFPLILEWRPGDGDSPLLASSLHELADLVRRQLGIAGFSLHPAYARYADKVAFTDPALFSDAGDSRPVASAYGALAAGLLCASQHRHPPFWPFPTLQWDAEGDRPAAVGGLREKLSVAADFGAEVVSVARPQMREAKALLRELRASKDGPRFTGLSLYAVRDRGTPAALAREIAWGPHDKRRRVRACIAAALATVMAVAGAFCWQHHAARIRLDWQALRSSSERLVEPKGTESARRAEALTAWRRILPALGLREAREFLLEGFARRNWLVPVSSVPLCDSTIDFTISPCRCIDESVRKRSSPVPRQWIPDGFPLRYTLSPAAIDAYDIASGNGIWSRDSGVPGLFAWRVVPDGMTALAELATTNGTFLAALDPFDGSSLWRKDLSAPISAFAFSGNGTRVALGFEDGSIEILELRSGSSIFEPVRWDGTAIDALAYEPGDAVLHASCGGYDIALSLVVQLDGDAHPPQQPASSASSARAVFGLLVSEKPPTAEAIRLARETPAPWGNILLYAETPPANRTTSLFSDVKFSDAIDRICNGDQDRIPAIDTPEAIEECMRPWENGSDLALAFQPDEPKALLEAWYSRANRIADKNRGYDEGGYVPAWFHQDTQAVWFAESRLAYALERHPGDPVAEDHRDRLFLKESGRTALRKQELHHGPQACRDEDVRRIVMELGTLSTMRKLLAAKLVATSRGYVRVSSKFQPDPTDDAIALWNKMLRNLGKGTAKGAMACMEAFLRKADGDPQFGDTSAYANALRTYIARHDRLGANLGAIIAIGYGPGASSHPFLRIGDIVVEVAGIPCRTVDDYIAAKRAAPAPWPLSVLRWDGTNSLREVRVSLPADAPPLLFHDLAEPKSSDKAK